MAEDKITGEESFYLSDDDEITDDDDDLALSQSDVAEDTSVTGKISDENRSSQDVTLNDWHLEFHAGLRRQLESIEKEIEELEVERSKSCCPVSQSIMAAHMNFLVGFRDDAQKQVEDFPRMIKSGFKQRKEVVTDEKPKVYSAGTFAFGGFISKQGQEGKYMLNPKPNLSLEAEKDMKKMSDDDKKSSRYESTMTKEKIKKLEDALHIGDFDELSKLLGTKNPVKGN